MSFRPLGWIFSSDLAVDLGTANTLVYVRGEGIVLNEPSVVAISQSDHSLLAVGHAAKAMLGRAPGSIQVLRPLRHGVIADFDTTERMLQYFITTVRRRRSLVHPRIVLTVPSGITQVEKRAVRDTAKQAGAREVFLIEQAMAAAVGAGLPIQEPGGHMIVDIGGGTTEVAILSLAGIVYSKSVRIAGDEMNESIIQYVRKAYNLLIGERQAEDVKIALGSARPEGGESETWAVKGRDLIDGFPKTAAVSRAVQACLEQAPPELAADIADKGIVLTGGGALLTGLATLLHEETDLSIAISAEPLACVAHGAGKLLDHLDLLRRVAIGT
jgi:rod shape-determining protein MreB